MMMLNNQNALIRIFSRLVSCAFLILSCAACFLIPNIRGGLTQLFVVAAYLILFQSYQNKEAIGITYYSFLMLGLASLACPHILYFVPLIWLLTMTIDFQFPIRHASLGTSVLMTCGLLAICTVIGTIHFIRKSTYDSIRIRLLYGFFIWMDLFAFAWLAFQPQHYDMLLRIIIINTAPLIAHFFALTSTKITNVSFLVLTGLTLLITAYNLWIISYPF